MARRSRTGDPKPDRRAGPARRGLDLLDSVMAFAVHTTLPAGARYTTLELKVNYIRAVALDAGRITAEGRVIHVGRTVATAESKAIDENGKLVAHGTTTCMIFL